MKRPGMAAGLLLMLPAAAASAAPIKINDDVTVNVGALVQPALQLTPAGAPDTQSLGTDFYLRRARIILGGSLGKHLSFNLATEQANFMKDGNSTVPFSLLDAFMTYKFSDAAMVDAGLIISPFTHHGMQGAPTLNTLDYHSKVIRYVPGTTAANRDTGVQLRGQAIDSHLSYRLGIFNGVEGTTVVLDDGSIAPTINPKDRPRVVASLRGNIMGSEPDYFMKGIYFAKSPIISVGVSVDHQGDAILNADGTNSPELGIGVDGFVDYPMGDHMELIFQGLFTKYDEGETANTGTGYFAEAGLRYDQLEPVVSLEHFTSEADASDFSALRFGLNYWIKEHNSSVKAEFASTTSGDLATAEPVKTVMLQGQLLF